MPIPPNSSDINGFTLLELLWVLLILGVLFYTAIPYFSGVFFQLGLERRAREVFMALTYCRQQALNVNHTLGLFFDLTEGRQRVTCYRQKGYDEATLEPLIDANNLIYNPLTKRPYLIEINQEGEYGLIRITRAEFGGNNWVEFNPLGEPNQTGGVTITGAALSYSMDISRVGRISFGTR